MKSKFSVFGMTCSACSAHVEKAVSKVDGVTSVSVSLLTNSMTVQHNSNVTTQIIVDAVTKAGYNAVLQQENAPTVKQQTQQSGVSLGRLVVSLAFCVVLMYVSMGHMVGLPLPSFLHGSSNAVSFALVQLLLCLPVWYVNRSYYIVGFKRLFSRYPNMDSLIAVGSTAGALYAIVATFVMSFALGKGDLALVDSLRHNLYFESSAMILALVDLGKYFEGRSKIKTGNALSALKKLAPTTAILLVDGNEVQVDSKSLQVGDKVVVKAGMSVPADGKIVTGSCFVDESAITGESIPAEKNVGDNVVGGTINVGGYVVVEVSCVGSDSMLSKIIQLVEEAGSSKAPIQKLADKISSVFVPIVFAISLVTFVVWMCVSHSLSLALNFAISVLVISCPCALGLATPVAIMVSTGKCAENGILVKNGEVLEHLSKIEYVLLDKTGTLTVGKPQLKQYFTTMDSNAFFAVVAAIEKQSEHPLGKAVVDYASQLGVNFVVVDSFSTLVGKGVVANVDGQTWAIGNAKLMQEQGVAQNSYQDVLQQYASQALTCLLVAKDGHFVGIIGVGDQIKQSSKNAIERLHNLEIKTAIITGDNATSAKAVCDELAIDNFYAEVLPHQKAQKVAEVANQYFTAMVGDGINDAPALASANVGISVASGSDIAVDSADVILVKNDICDVATAIELSKSTVRNIKQNLFWAFFYNALGIPIAAGVLYYSPLHLQLSPMIAAFAMSLSSLFVVTNALRLRFFKPNNGKHNKCDKTSYVLTSNAESEMQQETSQTHTNCNGQDCVYQQTADNQGSTQICQSQVLQELSSDASACAVLQSNDAQSVTQDDCQVETLQNSIQQKETTMKYLLIIDGMMCGHCTGRVQKALEGVSGVTSVEVSLENKSATVVCNDTVTADLLSQTVTNQGYDVLQVTIL